MGLSPFPMEPIMTDLTKSVKPDRSKIDTTNAIELKYWCRALNVSESALAAAVKKVGNTAATVRKELTNAKLLKPDDFPMKADGTDIKASDGSPIASTEDPVVAKDIVDRLNADDAQREEDKWSA